MASHSTPQDCDGCVLPNNEDIIAALCTQADLQAAPEVKNCLRAYKLDANEKSLKSAFNKFTKDVLKKTLIFLNVNVNDERDWNNILRPDLANEVICRVQNILCDTCGICNNVFATSLEEPLILQCEICGQNIHRSCLKNILGDRFHENITHDEVMLLINPFQLEGFHYLCSSCSKETIPTNPFAQASKAQAKQQPAVAVTEKISSGSTHNQDTQSGDTPLQVNGREDKPWRDRDDICTLFLQGNCPHGIRGKNCTNFHPRICNRYRKSASHPKYGCQLDNACKHFHPKICPNSLRSHTCYDEHCTFKWHLPRTRRNDPRHFNGNGHGYTNQNSGYSRKQQFQGNRSNYHNSPNLGFNSRRPGQHVTNKYYSDVGTGQGGRREGSGRGFGSTDQALDNPTTLGPE